MMLNKPSYSYMLTLFHKWSVSHQITVLFGLVLLGILVFHQAGGMLAVEVSPARAGHLDLTSWDQQESPVVALGGEWQLKQGSFSGGVPVAQSWESLHQQLMPVTESGSYSLQLDLPPQAIGQIYKLYAPHTLPFFEVYVNQKLVARSGSSLEGPAVFSRLQSQIPFVIEDSQLDIRVDIQPVGEVLNGLRGPLHLGLASAIEREMRLHQLNLALVIGGIVLLFLYSLVLYLQRQEISQLYFCGICLTIIFYIEGFHAHVLEALWGNLPLYVTLRLQRLTMYYSLPLSLYYVHALFQVPFVRASARVTQTICALLLASLFLPMRWMSVFYWLYYFAFLGMFPCMAWMIYDAYRQRREDLGLYLLSYLLLMATYVYDSLYYLRLVSGPVLGPWGLFLFCLAQSSLLAQRFARDYHLANSLSQQMQTLNRSLEQTIQQRTQHLASQNLQLENLSAFKQRVTQMLLHDLKTPLSLLRNAQLSSQMDLTQTVAEEMEHILQQFQDAEDIQTTRLPVQIEPVRLQTSLERGLRLFQLWISQRHVQIINEVPESLWIQADSEQFVRVVQNILSNALKSIADQGSIQIQAQSDEYWVTLMFSDSGSGFAQAQPEQALDMYAYQFSHAALPSQGIGLAYCKLAVEAQGGQILLENRERGACVSVRMRRTLPPDASMLRLSGVQRPLAARLYAELQPLAFYELSGLLQVIERYRESASGNWRAYLEELHYRIEAFDEVRYLELREQLNHADSDR